ncbi:MAG: SMC family ATPase [Anaeromyxobacter sp.]|nr:SMC family ATPase [Anaeromyxobacter sp.]
MRPLHLELTAFGPYQRTQPIDFAALGGSDLFLIHGQTGAGKTSIFDGITYALFGELAGTRGVDRLRADRAARDQATVVTFRFAMGADEYRVERSPEWERPKKVGSGTTTAIATASLWRAGVAAPLATGPGKVTEAVEGLLGMDVDQFTQVALLPQGEFKRLLCADSAERETLLRKLFATDKYTRVEDLLVERKKALDARGARLKERQAEVSGGEPAEALEARLAAAAEQAVAAAAAEATQRQQDQAALEVLGEAERLQARFQEREVARAEQGRALAEAPALEADRARLMRAEAAERARAGLEQAARAEVEQAARGRDQAAAAGALAAATLQLTGAATAHAAAEAEAPERARLTARAQVLEQALPALTRLTALDRALAGERAAAARAGAELTRAAAALAEAERRPVSLEAEAVGLRPLAAQEGPRAEEAAGAQGALAAAGARDTTTAAAVAKAREVAVASQALAAVRERAAGAARSAAALDAAREGGLAAELAKKALRPGAPCPVCGATDHPAPAAAHGALPEKADVEDARAKERALAELVAATEAALARQAGLLADLEARAGAATAGEARPASQLGPLAAAAAQALAEARAATARLGALEGELGLARAAVEAARAHRDAATAAEGAAREAAGRTEATRAELVRQLEQAGAGPDAGAELARVRADLAAREARAQASRAGHEAATSRRVAAAASLAAAEAALTRARAAAAQAGAAAAAACQAEGFADLAACQAALLSQPDRTVLTASIDQRAQRAFAASRRLGELEAALAGLAAPDVARARAARAATEQAAHAASAGRASLEAEEGRLRALTGRLAALAAELAEVAAALAVEGQVAELVRGKNAKAMSLQRFVLAARLEDVAFAASQQLQVMSRGRFRLRHDTAVARKNSAAGLSLVVEDSHTGVTDRPVGALSGGESFLASLALALGLSEVVLRRSGGRRLDSLFVDEGFGSLDEATLDVALRALEALQQRGRLVGVISHVAELKRRIPARIEVTATDQGSVATVWPA